MFKSFDVARDIVNQISVVNEVVSYGRGIFTGGVGAGGEANVKRYNHWVSGSSSGSFYHGLYNTNYSSSVATELIDITFGISNSSSFYAATNATNAAEKNRLYRLYAKQLLGNENLYFSVGGADRHDLIFLSLKRSQYKDEIKKGTVALQTVGSGSRNPASENKIYSFTDQNAANDFSKTTGGDVGKLMTGSTAAGLVFYNAGVLALVPDLISITSSNIGNQWSGSYDYQAMATSGGVTKFDGTIDAVRNRIMAVSLVNQSNLHSAYFFCRALNDEFNYSSNPTFVDSSGRIIVTSGSADLSTRTYITKVGLIGENNEILATAALSKPIKKTPDGEFVIKIRLDF